MEYVLGPHLLPSRSFSLKATQRSDFAPHLPLVLPFPGGTRIIEEVQNGLGLTTEQTADSWAVLREYGNMLSPSIVFVLKRVFKRQREAIAAGKPGYKLGLAFSFSPGVGVEGIMLKAV